MLPISTQSSAFWKTGVHAQSQMAPSTELLMQCKHASISKTLQRTDSFPRADCGKVPYFIFRTVPCSFFSAPITSAHLPRNCWRCYGITLYLPALLSACVYVCACIYVSICMCAYMCTFWVCRGLCARTGLHQEYLILKEMWQRPYVGQREREAVNTLILH